MRPISWKNASTLIMLARNPLDKVSGLKNLKSNPNKQLADYSCMLLKRSAQSSFFAKAFVFPGGATEITDFSKSWIDYFNDCGFSPEQLASEFMFSKQSRIPLYTHALYYSSCIPEVGYRICAIRETFEETGVLVCKSIKKNGCGSIKVDNLLDWQERIHHNPEEFLILCKQFELCPDIWSLYEWSNWLTPTHLKSKRYDTIFYLCVLDEIPDVQIDGNEITEIQWLDPMNAVKKHVQGKLWLAPPQMYELCRLAHFSDAEDLQLFAKRRQSSGLERWLPIGQKIRNEIMTLLPGDSLYLTSDKLETQVEEDRLIFESSGASRNRMYFTSPTNFRIDCNIVDPYGHKQPLNLVEKFSNETVTMSNM